MKTHIQRNRWLLLCLLLAGCSSGSTAPDETEEFYEFYYRVTITDEYGTDPEITEPGRAQVTWRDGQDQPKNNFDNPVTDEWESPIYEGQRGLKVIMNVTELTPFQKWIIAEIIVNGELVEMREKLMEETRTQALSVEYVLGQNNQ